MLLPAEKMVWPGSAMTRLTRSLFAGPGQWLSGGWLNTTMSPWCTSCQLKNAFQTRIRSPMPNVGSMDEVGIGALTAIPASDPPKPQPQPAGHPDALDRIKVYAKRGHPRRRNAVRMAPVLGRQRLDQVKPLEPVQRAVECARPQLHSCEGLDVLDQGVSVLGATGQARQYQDRRIASASQYVPTAPGVPLLFTQCHPAS